MYESVEEKKLRKEQNSKISTLINTNQIAKNRFHESTLIEVVQFLVLHQLPLRGSVDTLSGREDQQRGLFMSLLEFAIKKDPFLAECIKTIPKNATYTSHDIQNQMISCKSEVLTEEIVREMGDSWCTLKVDGAKIQLE